MIKSIKMTKNQFGNKILNYNNLVQIAHFLDTDYSCVKWKGCKHFKGVPKQTPKNKKGVKVNWSEIRKKGKNWLKEYYENLNNDLILNPCLGKLFYMFDEVSTHDIFELNVEDKLSDENYNVGVHFRGNDFKKWRGGNGILHPEYYVNAIEHIINDISTGDTKFILYTDDTSLKGYNKTINYLKNNNYNYSFGKPKSFIEDFKGLSECDAIISNPSTFTVTAAMMGKRDKYIVHSKKWKDFVLSKNNSMPFWKYAFTHGGNKNYYVNKIIGS